MTLNQINEFVILAQTRSYHRAAEILYISQSSLSKHIIALEAELGKPLFERTRRRVELSFFGQSFLPYATQITNIQRDFNHALIDTASVRESLSIGVPLMIGTEAFTDLTAEVLRYHPGCSINFKTGNSEALQNGMISGTCDIIIDTNNNIKNNMSSNGVISKVITTCHLAAILPKHNPLTKHKTISTSMLEGFPYIHLGEDYNFDGSFGQPLICVNDLNIAVNLVSQNCGYTIVSELVASRIVNDMVTVISLEISPLMEIRAFCLEASLEKPIIRDTYNYI